MSQMNHTQFYDLSFAFHEASLESIGKQLDKTLLSNEDLTHLKARCDQLCATAKSPKSKAELAKCYGRMDACKINNVVDELVEKAFDLVANKNSLSVEKLMEKADEIQSEIAHLWYEEALSISNRRFIRVIVYQLNLLQHFLDSKKGADCPRSLGGSCFGQQVKRLPEFELPPFLPDPQQGETAEFALDLCETAHYFYQNKIEEGMNHLHRFTPLQKAHLDSICLSVGADAPHCFLTKTITERRDQIMRFVRALVCYAHAIAEKKGLLFYPSQSEIHMMFQDVETLK